MFPCDHMIPVVIPASFILFEYHVCFIDSLYFCLAVCISSSRDRQRFSPDSKLITAHYNFIKIHGAEPPRQRYKSRRSEKSGRDARMCQQINCAVRGKGVSHKELF